MKKKFENEDQEREFWSKEDSTDHIDWNRAERARFPNLKPSVKTISLRIPESLLDDLKEIAHSRDVPYQSLIKVYLADRIKREKKGAA